MKFSTFRAALLGDRILHRILTRLFDYRDIVKDTGRGPSLYLRRYYVFRTRVFPNHRIFLHFINRSDDDRDLHDHPWDFLTLILAGGYVEAIKGKQSRVMRPGNFAHNLAEHTHRGTLIDGKPTWSLVRAWKARRVWGFDTPKGWVSWREYLGLSPVAQPDALEDV